VRILPAPTTVIGQTADGRTQTKPLSTRDVPESQWVAKRLVIEKPEYWASPAPYDSSLCVPTPAEQRLYAALARRPDLSVKEAAERVRLADEAAGKVMRARKQLQEQERAAKARSGGGGGRGGGGAGAGSAKPGPFDNWVESDDELAEVKRDASLSEDEALDDWVSRRMQVKNHPSLCAPPPRGFATYPLAFLAPKFAYL
jgi:hypothetical protein